MTKKYRPYFTAAELQEISAALKQSPTPSRLNIAQYLEKFILEINHGVRESSYTMNPRPTLADELGFTEPTTRDKEPSAELIAYRFMVEHGNNACTPKQLKDALSYAYLNDLMTPEQEAAYENNSF